MRGTLQHYGEKSSAKVVDLPVIIWNFYQESSSGWKDESIDALIAVLSH
jgi:hypothetical protein